MSLHLLLLLPPRPRLSRRRLHPPRPHTSRRMRRDTPLSPLSPPASTSLRYFLRPSCSMCRSPVLTPQTPTYPSTFGSCSLPHSRRPTCRLPWPQHFKDILITHKDVFAKSPTGIGFCNLLEHDIDTADAAPIRQPPRRSPLASGTAEDDLVAEMLAVGVIEPSDSPWASPVCLAKTSDGSYRFCVDYRRVNAVSRKDAYPIPDIQDAVDSLRGGEIFRDH